MPDVSLDHADRRLLDAMQGAFPLCERPFAEIARRIEMTEAEALRRVCALKENGIIRQISAIFDSAALGYRGALIAFEIPKDRLEAAARIVNSHPGVSHNYERDHAFSLWFTLTVPPESDLSAHAECLARETGVSRRLFLPAVRLFKIGVRFRMSEDAAPRADVSDAALLPAGSAVSPAALPGERFSEEARRAVVALQTDLPLVEAPFAILGERHGFSAAALLAHAQAFLNSRAMRRYAAILRHREAGYAHNVMTVWAPPAARAEEVGRILAGFAEVSHCYQRPVSADWPYSHYAMLHARGEEEMRRLVGQMAEASGIRDYALLKTVREFKKTRVEYFTPEMALWETRHLLPSSSESSE